MKKMVFWIYLVFIPALIHGNTLIIRTIHSGDKIEFDNGFTVRLAGITVPDISASLGYKTYDFVKRTLEGRTVKVITYTTNNLASGIVYGDDGLPFAQIIYGQETNSKDWSTSLNELLLKRGWARVDERYLPEALNFYKTLEQNARQQGLGMWSNFE